eukprot:TRINITY_DN18955_c0_g1_i1.p1 TRINITY_DN18955_c0_g1~~TRINITY_DN18955_c0_g1_i1.p1  ORF type:complete len:334 (+),score=62.36 TRINITY_DN18955_c0_g1_i1:100-1101(+)
MCIRDRPNGLASWTREELQLYFDSDGSQLPALSGSKTTRSHALKPGQSLWRVVHAPRVVLRAERGRSSRMVGSKAVGEEVIADLELDGWVRTAESAHWLLVDGAEVGLGPLLERVPPIDEEITLRILHPETAEFVGTVTARTHWRVEQLRGAICELTGLQPHKCVMCKGVMGQKVSDSGDSVLHVDSALYDAGWRTGDAPGYFYFGAAKPDAAAAPAQDMLAMRHWAVVGNHASNPICAQLAAHLEGHGRTVHRVNPYAGHTLRDVPGPIQVVDLVVNPVFGEQVVLDCAALGVNKVFIQPGACGPAILQLCASHGIEARQGCVLMCHFPALL